MRTVNGISVFTTNSELLAPRHTAVLTIDMQHEIGSEGGGYAKHGYDISRIRSIIPAIQKVLEASRGLNLPIAYTEFIHRDRRGVTLINGPMAYLHANEEWVSDVVEGSWEADTMDELAPRPGDFVIHKSRSSAIYHTYLDDFLKRNSIRTVVVMGCVTDGCVLKSAVDMAEHGYYPVIVRDAVNALTAERHELGLRYMELKFPVFSSQEVLRTWASTLPKETTSASLSGKAPTNRKKFLDLS